MVDGCRVQQNAMFLESKESLFFFALNKWQFPGLTHIEYDELQNRQIEPGRSGDELLATGQLLVNPFCSFSLRKGQVPQLLHPLYNINAQCFLLFLELTNKLDLFQKRRWTIITTLLKMLFLRKITLLVLCKPQLTLYLSPKYLSVSWSDQVYQKH